MTVTASSDFSKLDQLVAKPWSREIVAGSDGRYLASVPEFEGCFTEGDTPEAAFAALNEVLRELLLIALEEGSPIPEPRVMDEEELSGRFSVRVTRSLHRRLVQNAEREGVSLNAFVNSLLTASAVMPPATIAADTRTPIHQDLAALAVRSAPTAIGPLKGIARYVNDHYGDTTLACLLFALAAVRLRESEGGSAASRELGMAGALARNAGKPELAEALFLESIRADSTNLRSASALGQLLHHRGSYAEAVDCLRSAAGVDNHARLFLGWSLVMSGLQDQDEGRIKQGIEELSEALRKWAYANRDVGDRASWIRQLRRLRQLGARFSGVVLQLVEFANREASWEEIDRAVADEPWEDEGSAAFSLASESRAGYDVSPRPQGDME